MTTPKNRRHSLCSPPGSIELAPTAKGAVKNNRHIAKSKSQGGSAMIEFALAFPAIVMMMGTLFQFGYGFMTYNTLQGAIRGGARYASIADFDAPDGTNFTADVKNVVVYGIPNPDSDPPAVRGLTTSHVTVDSSNQDGTGIPITVSVSISGFELFKVFSAITLNNKPKSTFTYMGQYESP